MTFLQLRNAVIDNTQRSDKISVINNGINFALVEIAKLHEWYALRTTPADVVINANDLQTTLAADFYQLVEARCVNPASVSLSYPFQIIPKLSFVKNYPNVSAYGTGRPYVGYYEKGILYYFPKSSSTYNLRYTYLKLPTLLSLDTDVNPLVECDVPVISYATSYLFDSIQMFEAGNVWRGRFSQSIAESIRSEKRHVATIVQMEQFSQENGIISTSPEPWLDPFAGH